MVIEKFFQHPYTSDDINVTKTFKFFNYYGNESSQSYYSVPNTFFINDICNLLDEANIEYQKIEDYGLKIFNNNYYFTSMVNSNVLCMYISQNGYGTIINKCYMKMNVSSQYYPNSYHYKIRLVTNSESYFMLQVYDSDSSIIDYDKVYATKSLIFSTKCNIVNDNTELIFTTNALYNNDSNSNIIFNSGFTCNTLTNPNDVENSLKEFRDLNNCNSSAYYTNIYSPFTVNCTTANNVINSINDDCNYWNPESFFNSRFNLIDKVLLKPINLYNNILNTKDIYVLPRNFGQKNIDNTIIEIDNEEYYIFNITNSNTYKSYIPMCVKI